VKIKGFYDDVKQPTKKEVRSFLDSGFTTQKFKEVHELKKLRFNNPERVLRAIMAEPTFEIHGITGGYQGPGVKTIVLIEPKRRSAAGSCPIRIQSGSSSLFATSCGSRIACGGSVRVRAWVTGEARSTRRLHPRR
jgi:hypothetical protein